MARKNDLKLRLVEIAVQYLESGQHDPSLRDIAKQAGVSPMAPYRHFSDKAALLGAVVHHGFEKLLSTLKAADATEGDREAIIAQGMAYILFAHDNPALFALMFSADKARVALSDLTGGFDILSARVAQLRGAPDVAAALGCWSLVHGMATLQLDKKLGLQETQMRATLELMTRGLVQDGTPTLREEANPAGT